MSGRRPSAKLLLPLAILGVGALGVVLLVATREAPETRKPPEVAPLVRVVEAHPNVQWMYSLWFAWYAMHPETEVYRADSE